MYVQQLARQFAHALPYDDRSDCALGAFDGLSIEASRSDTSQNSDPNSFRTARASGGNLLLCNNDAIYFSNRVVIEKVPLGIALMYSNRSRENCVKIES